MKFAIELEEIQVLAKGKKEEIVEAKKIYQDLLMATGSNEIRL